MQPIKKLAVIGGDKRSEVCAGRFADEGIETALYGFDNSSFPTRATRCRSLSDALCGSDAVLLPLPVYSEKGILHAPFAAQPVRADELFEAIEDDALVFAGKPGRCLYSLRDAHGKHNEILDYNADETFQLLNALPTAEGAIREMIGTGGKTIASSVILVCGYGRIGRLLTSRLLSLGADVYASARKSYDLAAIEVNGAHPVRTSEIGTCGAAFDVIVNTVPSLIFDGTLLASLHGSPTIYELASKPYGVDFEAARTAGIPVVIAAGLPGKYTPVTSGDILFRTVKKILSERGAML